jgi:hypothetical protein
VYRTRCVRCHKLATRQKEIERQQRQREQKCAPAEVKEPPRRPFKPVPVEQVLARMSKEDRWQYELEGALPFSVASIACEDYDPTPVPQGCPSCFLRGGGICVSCPDASVKQRRREARAQGLILP